MKARMFVRHFLAVLVAVAFVAPSLQAVPALAADTLSTIRVTTAGRTFYRFASSLATTDSVDATAVTQWVNDIGKNVDHGKSNATLKLNKKKRRLDFKAAVIGYKLNRLQSIAAIETLLASAGATGTVKTSALPTDVYKPKVTKFGKTILVSLVQRKIYLYDNKKVVKTYRCAIGQRAYPTPTGTFRIGKKVKNPSWTNGYASWSKNMPSHIGPGPNNPLGTRALYVYRGKSDTGVRFHGVPHSEDSSIGHAASHGCFRMHRKDVENFFPRITVGTTVYIIK